MVKALEVDVIVFSRGGMEYMRKIGAPLSEIVSYILKQSRGRPAAIIALTLHAEATVLCIGCTEGNNRHLYSR